MEETDSKHISFPVLAQKGFLNIDKSGKRAIYIPSVTSKEIL